MYSSSSPKENGQQQRHLRSVEVYILPVSENGGLLEAGMGSNDGNDSPPRIKYLAEEFSNLSCEQIGQADLTKLTAELADPLVRFKVCAALNEGN